MGYLNGTGKLEGVCCCIVFSMVFNIRTLRTGRVLVVELLLKKSNSLEIDDNFVRYINTCFALAVPEHLSYLF